MNARVEAARSAVFRRALIVSLGVLAVLFAIVPRDLRGAKTWKECVDIAFADYNACLMNAGGWFERKLCDLAFEFDAALCTALIIGDIKKAYNEGSTEQP